MTRDNVTDFAASLVEMAKAHSRLPEIESELREAHAKIDEMGQHIQRLELRAHSYKAEIEALNAKIRIVEAERDDSDLRFLETEDKVARLTNLVRGAAADLGLVVEDRPRQEPQIETALSEPKPDMERIGLEVALNYPSAEGQHVEGNVGESATDPTANIADTASPSIAEVAPEVTMDGEGVSVPSDPTPVEGHIEATGTVPMSSAPLSVDADTSALDPEPNERWSTEWFD